jgi:hypothetical protein
MHALGVQVGYGPQLFHLGLALVNARPREGPEVEIRLAEARLSRAGIDAVDIGDRPVGGDGADVDAVGGSSSLASPSCAEMSGFRSCVPANLDQRHHAREDGTDCRPRSGGNARVLLPVANAGGVCRRRARSGT